MQATALSETGVEWFVCVECGDEFQGKSGRNHCDGCDAEWHANAPTGDNISELFEGSVAVREP